MESVEGKVLLDTTGCCKIGVGTTGTSFTGAGAFVLTSSLIGFGLDSGSLSSLSSSLMSSPFHQELQELSLLEQFDLSQHQYARELLLERIQIPL